MAVTLNAQGAWPLLRGFVCICKPAFMSARKAKNTLLGNLVEDLNNLSVREPKPFVKIEGNTTKPLKIEVIESYSDHPAVVGPRYQVEDIKYEWITRPGWKTSGVAVLAINRPAKIFAENHWAHCIKVYHVQGKLGLVTNNMFSDGNIIYDNVKYQFIRHDHIDKIIASFQANYQRRMFQQAGVSITSQAAYELAVKGPVRPIELGQPVVYGMKCIHFKPPDFTIEVHCIGEYEEFLIRLIHDIGQKLRSAAICSGIQCIRNAKFTLSNSLLRKHWRINHIIENIAQNEKFIESLNSLDENLYSEKQAGL